VGIGVLFTNMLLGGGLLAAAVPLAMYLRSRTEKMTRERAREMAPQAIREAAGKLGPKLEEMVQLFADRLDAWVVAAGEELHRELIEILKQAKTERQAGADEVKASIETCDEQSKQLGRALENLGELRKALWPTTAGEGDAPQTGEKSATESGVVTS
jgi:hypothetical protein